MLFTMANVGCPTGFIKNSGLLAPFQKTLLPSLPPPCHPFAGMPLPIAAVFGKLNHRISCHDARESRPLSAVILTILLRLPTPLLMCLCVVENLMKTVQTAAAAAQALTTASLQ
jgi:hypothetical protein